MANDFNEIKSVLSEYSKDLQDAIDEVITSDAKEALKEIKLKSSVKSGRYKKGWTTKKEKGFSETSVIIHNKDAYQLTHLLEYAHMGRNGQLVTPYTVGRIKEVEEKYNVKIEHNILKKIEETT